MPTSLNLKSSRNCLVTWSADTWHCEEQILNYSDPLYTRFDVNCDLWNGKNGCKEEMICKWGFDVSDFLSSQHKKVFIRGGFVRWSDARVQAIKIKRGKGSLTGKGGAKDDITETCNSAPTSFFVVVFDDALLSSSFLPSKLFIQYI